jgi:hypothetical protein
MISESVLQEVAQRVDGYAGAERREIIQGQAALLGVSEKMLYRKLRENGMGSGRKSRSDSGGLRVGVSEAQLESVASLILESWTEKYRTPSMPAWTAIQMAERMGIIPEGILIPGTLTRWMRRNNLGKQELASPTPHVSMMSAHPNEMHQYDVSVCLQWYIDEAGGIGHQRRNMDVYKNKAGHGRQIKRHLIVDHFSGAFYVAYAESEDTATSLEFLFESWGGKGTKGTEGTKGTYIFRGVPKRLYTDNGSVIRSAIGQQVCGRLGIDLGAHLPGSPRAKGSVESMMWKWECAFESQLRRFPARSLEELNQRAFEYAMWYNSERIHTRHGMSRFAAWSRITPEQLRELPEDRALLRSLAMRADEERVIDYAGRIRYDGRLYAVPDQGLWGKKCCVGPDIWCNGGQTRFAVSDPSLSIVVECEGKKFTLGALKVDDMGFTEGAVAWGEYRSPRETGTERAVKEIASVTPGEMEMKPLKIKDENDVRDISGREIEIRENIVERTYTRIQAKQEVARRLGYSPEAWMLALMDQRWVDKKEVSAGDIDDLMLGCMGDRRHDVAII